MYEKNYQQALSEVQEKAKEVKIANRPVNTLKSGPTAAGLALMEKRKQQEQERLAQEEKEARENKNDDMDVDDENGKGKTRRYGQRSDR